MTISQRNLPPRIRDLIIEVAEAHRVLPDGLFDRRGSKQNTAAKRVIIAQLHDRGFSNGAIGRFLGMHVSSVHYLLRRTLDRRREARERAAAEPIPAVDLSGEWAI